MRSGYLVRPDYPDGNRMFMVYRLTDAERPDESYNREVYASYSNHGDAIRVAKDLNAKAAEYYFRKQEE
jgi:hypothetical protein